MNNDGRLVITQLNNKRLLFHFNSDYEIINIKCINESLVDSVFVGRIDSINEGLSCAFVAISKEQKVFLPLSELKNTGLKCGDNVLVQIKTDALKTKLPTASVNLCLPGQYCVIHANGNGISASKKLEQEVQNELIDEVNHNLNEDDKEFKIVIRTNASTLIQNSLEPLFNEINELSKILKEILQKSKTQVIYKCLYNNDSSAISLISDIDLNSYNTIITDCQETYDQVKSLSLTENKNIKYYNDSAVSLVNLYSLRTHLQRALDKKVYLDCGGYLIIEPTEAMTVIDVNSGKYESKRKESREYIKKVNIEAAVQVARQLSIRNISGIIMVDFINMSHKEDVDILLDTLKKELSKDKIKTQLVDITPLGIVEITRKKIDLSLDKVMSD